MTDLVQLQPVQSSLSVPARQAAPRALTGAETATLRLVADTLIPAHDAAPAASDEPEFLAGVAVALNARADAFDSITRSLAELADVPPERMFTRLADLDRTNPFAFQALSTVIAAAWLLSPGTRDRIGYHGQQSSKARLDEAADEITSGVLDAVLDRDPASSPRWIR